jgi:hypothetical protein
VAVDADVVVEVDMVAIAVLVGVAAVVSGGILFVAVTLLDVVAVFAAIDTI